MNDAKSYVFPIPFTNIQHLDSSSTPKPHTSLPYETVLSFKLYEEIDDQMLDNQKYELPSQLTREDNKYVELNEQTTIITNNTKTKPTSYWTRKKLIIAFSSLALILCVLVLAVIFVVLATASKLGIFYSFFD
jgi:hypothetical protein